MDEARKGESVGSTEVVMTLKDVLVCELWSINADYLDDDETPTGIKYLRRFSQGVWEEYRGLESGWQLVLTEKVARLEQYRELFRKMSV